MGKTPLNVLLVEGNDQDARRVIAELKRGGFQPEARRVDDASSLKTALEAQACDVILCRYAPAQFDGREALHIVHDELALDTPFIFISDGIGEEMAVELMRAGAQDYVLMSNLARLPLAIWRELDALQTRQAKKQADERIEEQDRLLRQISAQMRDEFVSTVSHELRTPLTSIAGSLGLLASGAAGTLPDSAMHLLRIAHGNCERLVRLTNDILDLQHIEREAMDAASEPVDVRQLVEKAIEANCGYAEKFGVTVRFDGDGAPALVRADPDRLVQLATNLLSNAIKFSPCEAEVVVTVEGGKDEVRFSVRDRGPGIPEEARGRIFEKFFQADASDSREKGGAGLGLAIVKQIVDHLGGRVGFEPAPGGGALFTVVLPQIGNLPGTASRGLAIVASDEDVRSRSDEPRFVIAIASAYCQPRS